MIKLLRCPGKPITDSPGRCWLVTIFLISCLGFTTVQAQEVNLVENHDFSIFERCPFLNGQIDFAPPWYSPNGRTTDFAHECGIPNETGIPYNLWGFEFPYRGRGYAGIRTWLPSRNDNIPRNYREYLAAPLKEPLEAGEDYYLSFHISVGDSARFTSYDLGMAFYDSVVPPNQVLYLEPAMGNLKGRWLTTTNGWLRLDGYYRAGGWEKHLVIGCFLDDSQISLSALAGRSEYVETTYFYIDNVIVEPCKSRFPEKLILTADTTLCPEDEMLITTASVAQAEYIWNTGSQDTTLMGKAGETYMLEMKIGGCSAFDTVQISAEPAPQFTLGQDTILCPGEELLLSIDDSSNAYIWGDQSTENTYLVDQAGTYRVTATNGICSTSDSIRIKYDEPFDTGPTLDTLICRGTSVRLRSLVPDATFLWENLSEEPSFIAQNPGEYLVEIITSCFTGQQLFTVRTQECGCEGFFPNVFTPNGDGYHDTFIPELAAGVQDYFLEIHDRWGRTYFTSRDPGVNWDGKKEATDVPAGMYFWKLTYQCLEEGSYTTKNRNGYVQVLR